MRHLVAIAESVSVRHADIPMLGTGYDARVTIVRRERLSDGNPFAVDTNPSLATIAPA